MQNIVLEIVNLVRENIKVMRKKIEKKNRKKWIYIIF
jgi:hypothetical protein